MAPAGSEASGRATSTSACLQSATAPQDGQFWGRSPAASSSLTSGTLIEAVAGTAVRSETSPVGSPSSRRRGPAWSSRAGGMRHPGRVALYAVTGDVETAAPREAARSEGGPVPAREREPVAAQPAAAAQPTPPRHAAHPPAEEPPRVPVAEHGDLGVRVADDRPHPGSAVGAQEVDGDGPVRAARGEQPAH